MPEIEFDKRIPDPLEEVGIPETLRYKGTNHVQHCIRVTIESQSGGKWAKANGFKLKVGADGWPEVETDEILSAVMRAVNTKFRERESSDPDLSTQDFRIFFDRRVQGTRSRPHVLLRDYSPDGPEVPFHIDGDANSMLHETTIHSLSNLVDKLLVRCEGLIEHTITLSSQHKDMYHPMVQMMAIAHQNSVLGLEQQRSAMHYMYSTQRVEIEEQAKDRRTEKWMGWLKKPVNMAVSQFGQYMRARAGGAVDDDDDDDDDDDGETGETGEPVSDGGAEATGATKDPSAQDGDTMEHPIAEFARHLGLLIRPPQWSEASTILTKPQFRLFASVFDCKTDEQCVKIYDQLAAKIPLPKFIELNGVLDKKQQQGLDQLRKIIASGRDGWAKDGTKDGG